MILAMCFLPVFDLLEIQSYTEPQVRYDWTRRFGTYSVEHITF